MARRRRRSNPNKPLVPFSENYIWVETKESSFWRKKRGTIKPALLNDKFQENVNLSKIAGPAAKRLIGKLHPYLFNLRTGRIMLRISNLFSKTLKQKNKMDYSLFKDLDFQEDFPFRLPGGCLVKQKNGEIQVKIPITADTIPYRSSLITDYYFELILLHGDPGKEKDLRTDVITSKLYPFSKRVKESVCTLKLTVPGKEPWMAMLKLNSLEGNEMAVHPRHYGMNVIAVSS